MNKTMKIIIIVLIASVIGGFVSGLVGNQPGQGGTRYPSGLSADSTSPTAGQVRGTTILSTGAVTLQSTLGVTGVSTFGSDVTVTTSNTATSSIEVGCIDSFATSTETAVRLSATTTVTGGINALWLFGSCSDL